VPEPALFDPTVPEDRVVLPEFKPEPEVPVPVPESAALEVLVSEVEPAPEVEVLEVAGELAGVMAASRSRLVPTPF